MIFLSILQIAGYVILVKELGWLVFVAIFLIQWGSMLQNKWMIKKEIGK